MSTEVKRILGIGPDYDKKSADFLSSAIAKNSTDGFDYMKFKEAVNAMTDLDLEEVTAFKSAFATAKTIGMTKSALVSSAKHYLSVLMKEKSQFDAALNNRVKERIAAKKDEVLKLQQRIEEMKQKISELQKRIEDHQAKIGTAGDSVEKEKQKIRETQDKFETTFNAFVKVISEDIERLNQHI